MVKPYLFNEMLIASTIIKRERDYYICCDTHNHYVVSHGTIQVLCGCYCQSLSFKEQGYTPALLYTPSRAPIARARFEVYNKDEEFFHDHQTEAMYWLKNNSGCGDPYLIVDRIIKLLNSDDLKGVT